MTVDEVAKDIVDAALKVHRALGPGLLESAYQACLAHELQKRRHRVECEVVVPLEFEGVLMRSGTASTCESTSWCWWKTRRSKKFFPSTSLSC